MIEERDLDELLDLARVSPKNSEARRWLMEVLKAIPHLLRAKAAARPQAKRNASLATLIKDVNALRRSYNKLDPATRAELYFGTVGEAELNDLLKRLDAAARNSRQNAAGWRRTSTNYEAVKLLVSFIVRFSRITPSAKLESKFEQFARRAFEVATGEDRDLTRSIRKVLASGWVNKERERAMVYRSRTART